MTGIATATPTEVVAESGFAMGAAANAINEVAQSPIPPNETANPFIALRITTLL
jgi:hypothetical protein